MEEEGKGGGGGGGLETCTGTVGSSGAVTDAAGADIVGRTLTVKENSMPS